MVKSHSPYPRRMLVNGPSSCRLTLHALPGQLHRARTRMRSESALPSRSSSSECAAELLVITSRDAENVAQGQTAGANTATQRRSRIPATFRVFHGRILTNPNKMADWEGGAPAEAWLTPRSAIVIVREGEKTVRKLEEPPKQA